MQFGIMPRSRRKIDSQEIINRAAVETLEERALLSGTIAATFANLWADCQVAGIQVLLNPGASGSVARAHAGTVAVKKATVTGTVFLDSNADGVQEKGEKGIASATAFVDSNGNGKLNRGEKVVHTNSRGVYKLVLAPGTYHIGTLPKTQFSVRSPIGGEYTLTLASGQIAKGANFAIQKGTATNTGNTGGT